MTDRSNADSPVDDQSPERGDRMYDVPSDAEPGIAIVEAVADATGTAPIALPPLQDSVDVDALNALLGTADDDGLVMSITSADHVVVIDGDGTITVG